MVKIYVERLFARSPIARIFVLRNLRRKTRRGASALDSSTQTERGNHGNYGRRKAVFANKASGALKRNAILRNDLSALTNPPCEPNARTPVCSLENSNHMSSPVRPQKVLLLASSIFALSLMSACAEPGPSSSADAAPSEKSADATTAEGRLETLILADALERELDGDVTASAVTAARAAYAQQLFKPVWTRRGALRLADAIDRSFDYGLLFDADDAAEVEKLADAIRTRDPEARARTDIELTAAYLRFASEVSGGLKDEGAIVDPETDEGNPSVLTQAILDAGKGKVDASLTQFEPSNIHYNRLKGALDNYRKIYAAGGWFAIDKGPAIEPGAADKRLPALRERLKAEGWLASFSFADKDSETYDAATEEAVKEFQRRHGLEDDGVVGASTLDAMNESVESKIDSIVDNLHRWRVQGDLGERYVLANIPSFTAEGWRRGVREISMRTVVGRPDRQTPIFNDTIEYAVANPKWYAPRSIVQKDKLPKLRKDPGYATRGRYEVYDLETNEKVDPYDVDWSDDDVASKYRLVQMNGDNNALGEMKIMFPNQYSVYLHGTPDVELFDVAERAFSSGCVRLEDPVEMAKWIARGDRETTPSEIEQAVESGENTHLDLTTGTPVHITYFTVTVDESGNASFWRDIYKKEDGVQYAKAAAPYKTTRRAALEDDGEEDL